MLTTVLSGGLVGLIFGFILQRTRFCLTGGIARNNTLFYAFLIAITVESIGVLFLIKLGIIGNPYEDFSVLGAIVGSYLFGIGIVLAGGCATGTWYRAGEGLLGSWVALFFYMTSAAAMKSGFLVPLNQSIAKRWVINDDLASQLGIPVWYLLVFLVVITSFFVIRELRKPRRQIASLPPRYKGVRHYLFEKAYHKYFAGLLIGLVALIAWPASQLTGRVGGLGITTPSAHLISYIITGDSKQLGWGVFLVLGIFIGSFLAAKGSQEFRWRLPDLSIGASWAGGCTIGNGLTATAIFSSKGWIALPVTILGVWTASYIIFVKPNKN